MGEESDLQIMRAASPATSGVFISTNTNFHPGTETSVFDHKLSEAAFADYRRLWFERPVTFAPGNFPLHLDIEATGVCNLRCPFCSTTYKRWGPKAPGYMEMDLFQSIIDEGSDNGLCAIKLSFRGEPMLHPKLPQMVAYAKRRGVMDVNFNTNGTLLTQTKCRQLIEAGLDRLTVSFEGTTKEEYERLRVRAKFEKVVENVKNLKRLREAMGARHPQIRVQRVLVPDNQEPFDRYLAFWEGWADEVAQIDCREEGPEVDHRGSRGPWACNMLWQRMSILWDGTLLPCLMHDVQDFGSLELGNFRTVGIKAAWLGDRMKKYRRLHQKGAAHELDACDRCSYRATELKKLRVGKAA